MRRSAPLFIRSCVTACLLACLPALGQATRPASDHPDDAKPNLTRKLPQANITGVPFEQAIDFFRNVSGLNVNVDWHALELVNVTKQSPVSLRLTDVPLRRVLKGILDEAGAGQALTYYVEDGIIEITTRDAADQEMVTRVYPVDDLVMLVPDFVPPGLNLQSQSNQTSGQGGGGGGSSGGSIFSGNGSQQQDTAASKAKRADDLVKTIMGSVRPDIWRENGGSATIRYFNGHIIVTAPRSVQDALSHQ